MENVVEHAWHDTYLVETKANGAARAHGVGFARAGLAVGKDSGVVAAETAEDKVTGAYVEDVTLFALLVEDTIKVEFAASNLKFPQLFVSGDTQFLVRFSGSAQFAANQRAHSQGDLHRDRSAVIVVRKEAPRDGLGHLYRSVSVKDRGGTFFLLLHSVN